jgi:hypothetical protein
MYNDLIKLIQSFDTREAKLYWINALPNCTAIKGYLIVYFDLI